ncbi:CTP synthase [Pseudomonas sp. StFLB209]|nr:CTP synthase [Pseudomonas sp. StFLB209]
MNIQITEWDEVSRILKQNVAIIPLGQEFTARQIIGEPAWAPLQRKTRHDFGRHVRRNLEQYGLVFARMAGRVLVYKKSPA